MKPLSMKAITNLLFNSNSEKAAKAINFFRREGDKLFEEKKYFEALVAYNKSLCHSPAGSRFLSEGFAKRSQVYFQMKQYRRCLDNIQLARDNFEPTLERNLQDLEIKCSELLNLKDAHFDAQSFFKLSYPAHHRVPFIAECLELSENKKFGRFVFSKQDLSPGEVIAIEEPLFKFVDSKIRNFFKHQRCFNCLKSNQLSLLPGPYSGKI